MRHLEQATLTNVLSFSTFVLELRTTEMTKTIKAKKRKKPISPILKAFFTSDTRIAVLSHFFMNPGQSFYIRQLEKLLNKKVGQLRPELSKLEKIGLLKSSMTGNQRMYELNNKFQLFEEMKNIFLKTVGVGDLIREKLAGIKNIELAFIYGSFAKGDTRPDSDMDIMIVGNASDMKISGKISEIEKRIKREINYSLYTKTEIKNRRNKKDNFIATVFGGPRVVLIGEGTDELFRLT